MYNRVLGPVSTIGCGRLEFHRNENEPTPRDIMLSFNFANLNLQNFTELELSATQHKNNAISFIKHC